MSEKTKRPHVLEAIENVQTALAKVGIGKDMHNAGQKFNYRGIDQVLTTLSGLLAANRIVFATREPKLAVAMVLGTRVNSSGKSENYTILTRTAVAVSLVDGSELDLGTYSGEGQDGRDKSTSKAESMLFKYAAFLGFCIPLEGVLDDSDADSPADAPAAPRKPAKASKVAEAQEDADEAPEAPQAPEKAPKAKVGKKSKDTQTDEVDAALERIAATKDLEAAGTLAMELRGLRAHVRFGEVKAAMKVRIEELKED